MQPGSFQAPRDNNTQTQANSVTFQYPQAYNTQTQMNTGQFQQSPYGYPDIPPPPPPKQRHMALVVALVMALCLIVVLGGVLLAVMHVGTEPRSTQATSTPTVAPTPTATPMPVTAQSIVQDFIKHNLPIDQIPYGTKLNQWFGYSGNITVQSSVSFVDPSFCGGYGCSVGSVWLGVYLTSSDAQIVYTDVERLESTPLPVGTSATPGNTILVNRCLLIGEPSASQFVQIVKNDCV